MDKPSVFILDSNENSREILKLYLNEMGILDVFSYQRYEEGLSVIKKNETSPIVFVDITLDDEKVDEILNSLKLITTKIVVTSTNYSTDKIVKAMRVGAKEFLPKPIIKEDLKRVVEILMNEHFDLEESNSKIIAIYSNKGGIGKTTIATNLAYELSKTSRDKVALVDLNLQLGDVSTFLNLNPTFDACYVINKMITKEEDAILSSFEKYKDTDLYILSDPSYIEQAESITPQQIEKLFKVLKKVFPYVIVDMSSAINPNTLKILDKSDFILFTTIVNVPAIRNAQRCLNLFRSRQYPADKVKTIINRYMENDEIRLEDIEQALNEKVYWKIPNNYFSIMEAINKGVTVSEVGVSSNIANSFRDFAGKLADDIVKQALTKFRK